MADEKKAKEKLQEPADNVVLFTGATRLEKKETSETREIPEAAKRALAEAEERRRNAKELNLPKELGGRDGPEPVRYGDWEKGGLAIDF